MYINRDIERLVYLTNMFQHVSTNFSLRMLHLDASDTNKKYKRLEQITAPPKCQRNSSFNCQHKTKSCHVCWFQKQAE